jgi:hypothetical protein
MVIVSPVALKKCRFEKKSREPISELRNQIDGIRLSFFPSNLRDDPFLF